MVGLSSVRLLRCVLVRWLSLVVSVCVLLWFSGSGLVVGLLSCWILVC